MSRNRVAPLALLVLALSAGCGDDVAVDPNAPAHVTLVRVAGDRQHAPGLARLDTPLTIRALDAETQAPVEKLAVRFSIERRPAGGAQLSDSLVLTDRDGIARTELTLGADPVDSVAVQVQASHAPTQRFTALVSAAPVVRQIVPAIFRAGDTVTIVGEGLGFASAPGVVRFDGTPASPFQVTETQLRVVAPGCLAPGPVTIAVTRGGARTLPVSAEYRVRNLPLALSPLDGRVLPAAQLADCVVLTGENAHYVVFAQLESDDPSTDGVDVQISAGATDSSVHFSGPPLPQRATRDAVPRGFEARLRRRESSLASVRLPVASVRAPAAPPAIGSARSFEVIADVNATTFAHVGTTLRFAGNHILVWVDTTSPPELPEGDLEAIARVFDNDLFPLDEATFGATSDVDGNGRVHIVLTPVVNSLTAVGQCTLSGFVSGFFSAHDLYASAPHANGGEVFYGFVPDSLGKFGCAHPASEFARVIRTTFVHELQHIINYQQHVLLRGGGEEEIWLNEGLSHIAEETASKMYETRYPAPFGRGTPDQLFPDSSSSFILFNMINAYLFLRQPYATSLTHFIEGGTIEERGAAWLFLRWLADQYGEDVFRRLVQTSMRGKANVADKTGEPFARLEGDFAIAAYADSIPGLPRTAVKPRWHFTSRNLRVLFQRLNAIASFPPFPIDPLEVPYGGSVSGSIRPGGFVVLSVQVPPGASATTLRFAPHNGGPWPAGLFPQVSILRIP